MKPRYKNRGAHLLARSEQARQCSHDPEYAARILRSSLLFVPGVILSTIITMGLIGLEVVLIRQPSHGWVGVGLFLALFHASYIVNTMMQARIAVADLDRCLRGYPPRRLTPEIMARSLRHARDSRTHVEIIPMILTIGTPFFPIAAWAIGEIIALTRPEVLQKIADLSEDEHRLIKPTGRARSAVVSASREIVLGQASRTVLAGGV